MGGSEGFSTLVCLHLEVNLSISKMDNSAVSDCVRADYLTTLTAPSSYLGRVWTSITRFHLYLPALVLSEAFLASKGQDWLDIQKQCKEGKLGN